MVVMTFFNEFNSRQKEKPRKFSLVQASRRTRIILGLACLVVVIIGVFIYKAMSEMTVKDSRELVRLTCVPRDKTITNAAAYDPAGTNYFSVGKEGVGAEEGSRFEYSEVVVRLSDPLVMRYYNRTDLKRISLIACVNRDTETKTDETCEYDNVTLTVYDASYSLSVYEAKTGKLIAKGPLEPYDGSACSFVTVYDPSKKRIYKEYSEKSMSKIMHDVLY